MKKECVDYLEFHWIVSQNYTYLKNVYNIMEKNYQNQNERDITIYINQESPFDIIFEKVTNMNLDIKFGVDALYDRLFISYYFKGEITIVTDTEKGLTVARISNSFKEKNKQLFLGGIIRKHLLRHFIYAGYCVYHAAAIIDKINNATILILGLSGTGKTTFALDAVKSGRYKLISEDKVIFDPAMGIVYGNSFVHIKQEDLNKFANIVNDVVLINGGNTQRKYQACINKENYCHYGKVNKVIILNQNYNDENSFCKIIIDKSEIKKLIKYTQQDIYLSTESKTKEDAIKILLNYPVFELYRNSKDRSFQIYEEQI